VNCCENDNCNGPCSLLINENNSTIESNSTIPSNTTNSTIIDPITIINNNTNSTSFLPLEDRNETLNNGTVILGKWNEYYPKKSSSETMSSLSLTIYLLFILLSFLIIL
jgi:hypothetical protein